MHFFNSVFSQMFLNFLIILLSLSSYCVFSSAINQTKNEEQISLDSIEDSDVNISSTSQPSAIIDSVVAETTRRVTVLRSIDDLKLMSRKRCSRYYTLDCLKVDMISYIDRMGKNTKLNIVSGITVVSDQEKYASYKRALGSKNLDLFTSESDPSQLDELLLQKFTDYIRSLSLDIQIFQNVDRTAKSIKDDFLNNIIGPFEGRADKKTGGSGGVGSKINGALSSVGLMTGGALLWLGFSTMAAVATKALITAVISLVISCFTAYRTSGSSHSKSTTYEIVAKPLYPHAHTSVAEIQHEPHPASSGLGYGRNMEWDKSSSIPIPVRLAASDDMAAASATHDMVYKAHVRPIYKRAI